CRFFFSSRRRHTRSKRDWSSDVCSSDLVDGVPIDNFTGMSNNDFWNPSLDMGNGLSDINPNDIASLTVLKGPSAAALYGSRAGNGAILITTMTGTKNPGLVISVSSNLGFSSIFTRPEMLVAFGLCY